MCFAMLVGFGKSAVHRARNTINAEFEIDCMVSFDARYLGRWTRFVVVFSMGNFLFFFWWHVTDGDGMNEKDVTLEMTNVRNGLSNIQNEKFVVVVGQSNDGNVFGGGTLVKTKKGNVGLWH